MSRKWVLVILVAVALAAFAYNWSRREVPSSPTPGIVAEGPKFESFADLTDALAAGGLECKRAELSSPEQSEEVGAEFGLCHFEGKKANVHVYEDPARVAEHVESNLAARGQNPNYFTSLVYGGNWVVDTYRERLSERVQEILGGIVR